ncbi:uncharacterized protein LOC130240820 isoform X2 [Danio aesculapii]|uniref:uncharacterized protein LOC130240820 isoform X2 n=1 Tax=Danio aesculapii TaxID=1142201 RepID=UPI0024C087FA|nr:uncharacterized protein LOC130240820 isoform X2 [Danio aesculapii]
MACQLNSTETAAFDAINQYLHPRTTADNLSQEEDEQEAPDVVQASSVSSTRPEKRRLDYTPVLNKRRIIYTHVQEQQAEYDGGDEDETHLVPRSPATSPLGPNESSFEIHQQMSSELWSDNGGSGDGYDSTLGGDSSPAYTPQQPLEEEEEHVLEEDLDENKENTVGAFSQHAAQAVQTFSDGIDESRCYHLILQYLDRNEVKINQISEYVVRQLRTIDEQQRVTIEKLTEVQNILSKGERDCHILSSMVCSIKNSLVHK